MSELNKYFAIIQEQHAIKNLFNNNSIHFTCFPEDYTIHHNLNLDHAYGAAIFGFALFGKRPFCIQFFLESTPNPRFRFNYKTYRNL